PLCGTPTGDGTFRVGQDAAGVWLRRRVQKGYSAPALVLRFDSHSVPRVESAESSGGAIVLRGHDGAQPWSATVAKAGAFADTDGDGLTDQTEAFLGTQPNRTDTDGDGSPDAVDAAPRAAASHEPRALVVAEAVRYVSAFLREPGDSVFLTVL